MVHILIVEDDAAISNLIRSTLQGEGYQCTCALDGKTGADLLDSGRWDLVLLDLMLPEISGYDLLEYIQPMEIPVIVISESWWPGWSLCCAAPAAPPGGLPAAT